MSGYQYNLYAEYAGEEIVLRKIEFGSPRLFRKSKPWLCAKYLHNWSSLLEAALGFVKAPMPWMFFQLIKLKPS